jgi:hypothetical protein
MLGLKKKKLFIIIAMIFIWFFFFGTVFWFYENILEFKYLAFYVLTPQYNKDKALIEPYFDEEYYFARYRDEVEKSGLKPIDHFLRKGWYSADWTMHRDPNSWFNITIYQDRLLEGGS